MRRRLTVLTVAAAAVAVPATAAAQSFVIRGAGFGHGIGMSQYGAYGYALQGFTHERILAAYYQGTALGQAPGTPVRVLLASGRSSYEVSGLAKAGEAKLDPAKTYRVSQGAVVEKASGRTVAQGAGPILVSAPAGGTFKASGKRWRGGLQVDGNRSINVVGMEDYLRGVVPKESPASWPAEALQAQAVAARTYALTTSKASSLGFDHYTDTRSQVYGGAGAEDPRSDAAIAATAGQVVTQAGKPVTTYFFSTSGGYTENVENSFIGALAQPWLRGVADPFDDASPRHRWRISMSMSSAARRLRGLYRGSFRGIEVTKRGVSPRVVKARVLGSGGNGVTTGPELRKRLGLFDTWAAFTVKRSSATTEKPAPAAKGAAPASAAKKRR